MQHSTVSRLHDVTPPCRLFISWRRNRGGNATFLPVVLHSQRLLEAILSLHEVDREHLSTVGEPCPFPMHPRRAWLQGRGAAWNRPKVYAGNLRAERRNALHRSQNTGRDESLGRDQRHGRLPLVPRLPAHQSRPSRPSLISALNRRCLINASSSGKVSSSCGRSHPSSTFARIREIREA